MLIRVMVQNFKSFSERTELDMISSAKIRRKNEHTKMRNGAKVLKYAAVYGANAAGKSNLVQAFSFLQRTLRDGLDISSADLYCRNSETNKGRESVFEIQFTVGERVFAYGFTAILAKMRVCEEWLYELRGGRPRILFSVNASSNAPITTELDFSEKDKTRFRTYADDFTAGADALFLSELNRSKRFASGSKFRVFVETFRWLTEQIVIITPAQPPRDAKYLLSDDGIRHAGELLSSFDTGIAEACPEPMSLEAFADAAGDQLIDQIRTDTSDRLREVARLGNALGKIRGCLQTRDGLYFFDVDPSGISNVSALRLRHRGTTSLFDFREESDGTRRLFDLMGMLLDGAEDTVYVVDEIERSLHPMLVRRFLELFMDLNAGKACQIVFSSHEASIMDQELFRRDEIWFVDRGDDGASRLYSLDRFKDRFDKDVAKAYLEGRYGAVPAFKSLRGE